MTGRGIPRQQWCGITRSTGAEAGRYYLSPRTLFLSALLLAAALLIGVILYITRSILNPLLALARRMRALADHDTDVAIPSAERKDEMGEMARSVVVFRENALALTNSQRRLLEQAAELEQALENEQRLAVQQRNFVSMTSHEFRTPLTIIDGHAQRLIKVRALLPRQQCDWHSRYGRRTAFGRHGHGAPSG